MQFVEHLQTKSWAVPAGREGKRGKTVCECVRYRPGGSGRAVLLNLTLTPSMQLGQHLPEVSNSDRFELRMVVARYAFAEHDMLMDLPPVIRLVGWHLSLGQSEDLECWSIHTLLPLQNTGESKCPCLPCATTSPVTPPLQTAYIPCRCRRRRASSLTPVVAVVLCSWA
jgi:hypothetical protein